MLVPKDPNDEKDVIIEIRAAVGGDEAAHLGRRPLPHVQRYAETHGLGRSSRSRAPSPRRAASRRSPSPSRARAPTQPAQVRGRAAPGAAGPQDRVAGPGPHLDRHGGGAARGRGRRGGDPRERPRDRRVPLHRARRPVGQHHRLGGPDHPQAHRHGGHLPGREEPAAEQDQGDAGAAGPAVPDRVGPGQTPSRPPTARPRWGRGSGPRRSAPTTTGRTGSPTTASA